MRAHFFAAALALGLAAAPAQAQNFWGLQRSGSAMNSLGIVSYQSRDWSQCIGDEQIQPQRAIAACGRIVGERISRDVSASALYYRSVLYRQMGENDRADADVDRAIDLMVQLVQAEPDHAHYFHNLILLRTDKGDFEGAAADYERLAARDRQAIEPRLRQAEFRFRAGDYFGAASIYDVAARMNPESAEAQSGRCEALAASHQSLDAAQQACEEALRLSGQSAAAFFSRGFFHFTQGRMDDAIADFQAAGERDNTNPFAAYGYAVASLRLGRHEAEARELLTNVTAAVPEVEMYARAGMTP